MENPIYLFNVNDLLDFVTNLVLNDVIIEDNVINFEGDECFLEQNSSTEDFLLICKYVSSKYEGVIYKISYESIDGYIVLSAYNSHAPIAYSVHLGDYVINELKYVLEQEYV